MWHILCEMWHVVGDIWHMTGATWHITCDMLWGVNILSIRNTSNSEHLPVFRSPRKGGLGPRSTLKQYMKRGQTDKRISRHYERICQIFEKSSKWVRHKEITWSSFPYIYVKFILLGHPWTWRGGLYRRARLLSVVIVCCGHSLRLMMSGWSSLALGLGNQSTFGGLLVTFRWPFKDLW